MPSADGSVTRWLRQLQTGDRAAAQPLWERYFRRLVGLAGRRLHGAPRGPRDKVDVALSAFDSFYRGAERGRFPNLADRDCLWRLLVVITRRKASRLRRDEGRQPLVEPDEGSVLEQALSREPTPAFAAQMTEECERLLLGLGDDELKSVALLCMEGYTVKEIARMLGCCERTVKRKLSRIRGIWKEIGP
jgi:DNA-directed RNA polymerase specialized sigma24 family protein